MVIPRTLLYLFFLFLLPALLLSSFRASAAPPDGDVRKAKIIEHWHAERRAQAIPRDFYRDKSGAGFMSDGRGGFVPYGLSKFDGPVMQRPSGNTDTTAPVIAEMNPADSATIGANATFSARVTDSESGVRSVTFLIRYPSGATESFNGSNTGNDVWAVNLQGFTDGAWSWWVSAKDGAKRGGNTATSAELNFTVSTGSDPGDPPTDPPAEGTVTNAAYSGGGAVQTAAGRIYFEMPGNAKRKGPWSGYVCSGTVVRYITTEEIPATDRSIILTAAHCAYDDVNKAFARNVLFIPDQSGTTASGTDTNCSNDPIGCWAPHFAVVDVNWTNRVFPNNVRWDYAFYVVEPSGAHSAGLNAASDVLHDAAGYMNISFDPPMVDDGTPGAGSDDFTHALGYSASDDPNFMYCAEDMTTEGADNWWLPSCELSGGSSGGPWVQPLVSGDGPVMSVNSWGYTTSAGMAGPFLDQTSALCIYNSADSQDFNAINTTDGEAGVIENCP